jgi:hypothetical protein
MYTSSWETTVLQYLRNGKLSLATRGRELYGSFLPSTVLYTRGCIYSPENWLRVNGAGRQPSGQPSQAEPARQSAAL